MSEPIIAEVCVEHITPGPNDRKTFDRESLVQLAESIREHGLAQPITVRKNPAWERVNGYSNGEPSYEIVAGERRFRAVSTILKWYKMPVIIRDLTDEGASSIMLAENTSRADLDPIEEANAYQGRVDRFGWSPNKIAGIAGVSTDRVKKRIALLALHDDVQHLVAHGNLPLGHAAAMFELDHNRQLIALRVFREGKGITLRTFRKVVADLLAEQNQDSLFDLATFYIEQSQEAEERILRGKGAEVPVPTRPDLPKAVMETTDSTSAVILNYIQQLESTGLETEAATIGTLYEQLIHGNCMGLPA